MIEQTAEITKKSKAPAFQFYPGDWLRDSISGCSIAAQGLWLRIMFIMHDSERYGYLIVNGRPMTGEEIARRCGVSQKEYDRLLQELFHAGVPSFDETGEFIYSRRMVRDFEAREYERTRKAKQREIPSDVPAVSQESPENVPSLSHSSSSSTSSSDLRSSKEKDPSVTLKSDISRKGKIDHKIQALFVQYWPSFWSEYPKKKAKKPAEKSFMGALLRGKDPRVILKAVRVQKTWPEWQDPKYIPNAATFLNQDRFEDEQSPSQVQTSADGVDSWMAKKKQEEVVKV